MAEAVEPYAPLGVPQPIDRHIWIVDGPVARMRYGPWSLPFPTRMTVVRLPDGRLWLHSPVAMTSGLRARIDQLGEVAALVVPNRLHWLALARWQEIYPDAVTWAVPGVRARRRFRIDHVLGSESPPWSGTIGQLLVPGRFMTEAVFLHRDSRTLIVTDLIENFEAGRVNSRVLRWLMRVGGVVDPHGSTPRDLRLTFRKRAVRGALETMLGWGPERVVMAHGRPYLRDGAAELSRALAWAR